MKILKTISIVLIAGSSLTLLPSCKTDPNPKQNPPTNEQNQVEKELKIGGSTSTYAVVKILADAYASKTKNTVITFLPPSQSESTIAGVREGLLDLGSISKQLTLQELGNKLAYREIAKDALLVATHSSVTGVTNITTDNLKGIYSGAITNWKQIGGPDAKIIVLDRPEDESAKRLLRKYYLGEKLKNSPTAVIMRQEPDLIAAIGTTPYSIGAFSLAYAISHQLPANRLSLNGIAPTPENVRSNKYQMIRTIGIVSAKIPSEASQEYIDFALSSEGSEILSKSGFVPSVK